MSGSETDKVIEPCPFCGGKPAMHEREGATKDHVDYQLVCRKCGNAGPCHILKSAVIAHWNQRSALSAAQGEIARYREAMEKRLVAGHNDTCELMLIKGDPMATCTCGHNAIGAALSPPSQQEIQR